MYLFGNKINIWTHHSIWLVFSVRGGVSISPSCGKSAAAVLSHYRTSLYSIKKNPKHSTALLNKIILIPPPTLQNLICDFNGSCRNSSGWFACDIS